MFQGCLSIASFSLRSLLAMKVSSLLFGFWGTSVASLVDVNGLDNCVEIVKFPVTLTLGRGSPDGFERDMIFVDGQFPGPTLEMNEGATVEVSYMDAKESVKAYSCSSS